MVRVDVWHVRMVMKATVLGPVDSSTQSSHPFAEGLWSPRDLPGNRKPIYATLNCNGFQSRVLQGDGGLLVD